VEHILYHTGSKNICKRNFLNSGSVRVGATVEVGLKLGNGMVRVKLGLELTLREPTGIC